MSYITIDNAALEVRHKHVDRSVVNGLAYLELSHVNAVTQEVSDDAEWMSFTDYELKRLYTSMTGHKYEGFNRTRLLELVTHAALALPDTDVNAAELSAQVACVKMTDKGFYRYAKGAMRPAVLQTLFTPPALRALTVPPDAVPPTERKRTPIAPSTLAPQHAAPAVPTPRTPREIMAPRSGSRATIFEVADAMWAAAGSPTDVTVVLHLRKQMMTTLEAEHCIKKTTSSTALGDWQKLRLKPN